MSKDNQWTCAAVLQICARNSVIAQRKTSKLSRCIECLSIRNEHSHFPIDSHHCKQTYLSAIERAFSTSAMLSMKAMYFIQTKLLLGELRTSFSNSSAVLGISFSSNLASAALISCSLQRQFQKSNVQIKN